MPNGFSSWANFLTATQTNGQQAFSQFQKVSANAATTSALTAIDLLQGTIQPPAITFSGTAGAAQIMNSSTTGALPLNANQSPKQRYLIDMSMSQWAGAAGATRSCTVWLCDFLLYYPSLNINSPTTLNNTNTLQRYTNGLGVHCCITTTTALTTSAPTLNLTYSDNNSNSQTQALISPSATATTSALWTTSGAYGGNILLPMGSTTAPAFGIKSLSSYTISNGTATGAVTALLFKPLAMITIPGNRAYTEQDFFFQFPAFTQIQDGACLGFLVQTGRAMAQTADMFVGKIRYGWN